MDRTGRIKLPWLDTTISLKFEKIIPLSANKVYKSDPCRGGSAAPFLRLGILSLPTPPLQDPKTFDLLRPPALRLMSAGEP
jgi:hypothetical protein